MMRFILCFCIFIGVGKVVFAADIVTILSGEHDGYTRLVFNISPNDTWEIRVEGDAVSLVLPETNLTFDASKVFSRIGKDRLISTTSTYEEGTSVFMMELGCDCEVKASPYQEVHIIVDIFDPEILVIQQDLAPENPTHITPQLGRVSIAGSLFLPPNAITSATPRAPGFYESESDTSLVNIGEKGGVTTQLAPSHDEPAVNLPPDSVDIMEEITSESELTEAVENARMKLLEQLTMAAEQGLLEFSEPITLIEEAAKDIPEPAIVLEDSSIETIVPLDDKQIIISSVYERDADWYRRQQMGSDINCLPHETIDIAAWGSGADFPSEIANIRAGMLQEFDLADTEKVKQLIRLYIRYGFGVEALSYLEEYRSEIPENVALARMAAIMSSEDLDEDRPTIFHITCDGAEAMWGLLDVNHSQSEMLFDSRSVVMVFSELPVDIRRVLGPQLVRALIDMHLIEVAEEVSNILERAPGEHGAAHSLTKAEIAHDQSGIASAVDLYAEVVSTSSEESVSALIVLANLAIERESPVSEGMVFELGAAANMYRGTREGLELRQLEAGLLAQKGDVKQALRLLVKEVEKDPENAAYLHAVILELLRSVPHDKQMDELYPELIIEFGHFIPTDRKGDDLRIYISRELVEIGMPNMALDYLQPTVGRKITDGLLVAARANLLVSAPEVTLELLEFERGDFARRYRIEAYLQLGNFDKALHELENVNNPEIAFAELSWFAGNWASAAMESSAAAKIQSQYARKESEQWDNLNLTVEQVDREPTLSALQDLLAKTDQEISALENIIASR